MSNAFKKSLIAAGLALAAAGLCTAPAFAAAQKQPAKAAPKIVKSKAVQEGAIPDGPDADITDTTTTEYNCELGNKVTIYHNDNDDTHIALRWKKRIHRLEKVGTTTGAQRYENGTFGLTWIGIPSKGMLLDAKLNRQLANECKDADQSRPDFVPTARVPKKADVSTKVKEVVEPIVPPQPAPALTPAAAPAPSAAPAPVEVPVAAPAPAPAAVEPKATPI